MNDLATELLAKMPPNTRIEPVTVVTITPSLTVNIAGAVVTAKAFGGQAFNIAETGFALWAPPLPPICFSTTSDSSGDTGWINMTYDSAYSAGTAEQLAYRKIGNQVWIRGGATRTPGYAAGIERNPTTTVLPVGARPVTRDWRVGSHGTGLRSASIRVDTAGVLWLGSWDTSVLDWISACTTFRTD